MYRVFARRMNSSLWIFVNALSSSPVSVAPVVRWASSQMIRSKSRHSSPAISCAR